MTTTYGRKFPVEFVCCSLAINIKYGLIASAVFGLIWSRCGLSRQVCCASQETLGKELGITRQTVGKKIKLLEEDGLIKVISRKKYDKGGLVLYITYCEDKLKELEDELADEIKKIRLGPFYDITE